MTRGALLSLLVATALAGGPGCSSAGPLIAPLRYAPVAPTPEEVFRRTPPDATPVSSVVPPAFQVTVLPNGLHIAVAERHALPIVTAQLVVERGAADVQASVDDYGIFRAVLESGTASHPLADVSSAYARLGAPHGTFFSADGCGLFAKVSAGDLDAALALIADSAQHPRLTAHLVTDVRGRWLQELVGNVGARPLMLARNVQAAIFGVAHPYGFARPPREHVESIGPEALGQLHGRLFNPAQTTLVVVGDTTEAAAVASATRWLGSWASVAPASARPSLSPAVAGPRVVLVKAVSGTQADAAVAALGPGAADADTPALEILARLLGGLSSRLRGEVRVESGAAYRFGAAVRVERAASTFVVSGALDGDKAVPALAAVLAALAEARDHGVREPDFERARENLLAGYRTDVSAIDGLATVAAATLLRGLPLTSIATYPQRLLAVTRDDVRRVAQRYLAPEALHVVVVGGPGLVRPLAELGLGPVEVRDGWAEGVDLAAQAGR